MKKFIRFLTFSLACLMLITSTACGSMYHSDAGTMEELCGTYELTRYEKKDENKENYDYKTPNGIVAYMVIKNDGFGYYFYKDNETELKAFPIAVDYIADDDDESLIKGVDTTTGVQVMQWDKKVGCGDEPKMGFNKKNKTLNWTITGGNIDILNQHETVEYSSVLYTKISDKTNFDTVNAKLGSNFTTLPKFELSRVNMPLVLECRENSLNYGKYDYFVVDIDTANLTADIYYQKVGGTPVVLENYDGFEATFTIVNGFKTVTMTFDKNKTGDDVLLGHEFVGYCPFNNLPPMSFYYENVEDGSGWSNELLNCYVGLAQNVNEVIAELTAE